MSYVILQDSRLNKGMNLALIDRSKNNAQWWTSVMKNAMVFSSKKQAEIHCSKYKFNNPRVVPFDNAKKLVVPIVTVIIEKKKRRRNIFDMSSFEYKQWLGYSDVVEQGGPNGEY